MRAVSLYLLLDRIESYICQGLLCFFVVMLFLQITLRNIFDIVIPWSEEISRFSFVWFVFFGATYAARLAAHNRVTIQFLFMPKKIAAYCMLLSDIVWCAFNIIMIQQSLKVIDNLSRFTFKSPALQWSMEYVYWIFPISFGLMTIRILQVNYIKFVLGQEVQDVDKVTVESEEATS